MVDRPPLPRIRRLTRNRPPFGEKVWLAESFRELPTGLIGIVPSKEEYDAFVTRNRPLGCLVRVRGILREIPFSILCSDH